MCNQAGSVSDASPANFRIGLGTVYYVNDGSTSNDEWCVAAGSDANDGLSPGTPKASVQAVLDTYDLEPGDLVRIDTGVYTLTNDITVGAYDGGSTSAPVVFVASPYGVTFNRGGTGSGNGWSVAAGYVTITTATSTKYPALPQSWVKMVGGARGISLTGGNNRVSRCEVVTNGSYGIYVYSANSTVENCLARGSGSYGICVDSSASGTTVRNNTVAGSGSYGIYSYYGHYAVVTNNIVWADGTGRYGFYIGYSGYTPSGWDYNNVFTSNGAKVGYFGGDRASLTDWRTATAEMGTV